MVVLLGGCLPKQDPAEATVAEATVAEERIGPMPQRPSPVGPDARPLSERTPARLARDVPVPVPDTDLTAILLDRTWAKSRPAPNRPRRLVTSATIRITTANGDSAVLDGPFGKVYEVFGRRLYLDGLRSETRLYAIDVP